MTTYGTSLDSAEANGTSAAQKDGNCCRLLDYSEPVVWTCTVFGCFSLVYAVLEAPEYWVIASVVLLSLGCLASWRIRRLGVAFALMESVDALKMETTRLSADVQRLETIEEGMELTVTNLEATNFRLGSELNRFEGMVGLLGEEVGDITEARKGLLLLYDQYAKENTRHQANNTLSLFTIVDNDRDGELSAAEVVRMQGYIRTAYGFELDLSKHDSDNNHSISLEEFIKIFDDQMQE